MLCVSRVVLLFLYYVLLIYLIYHMLHIIRSGCKIFFRKQHFGEKTDEKDFYKVIGNSRYGGHCIFSLPFGD